MSYFADNYENVRYPIQDDGGKGLRRGQLGALHAIASHSATEHQVDSDPPVIVMPTGSGKTDVMIMSAFVCRATRVLIITSSRLVRHQIAAKCQNLDTLREMGALVNITRTPRVREIGEILDSTEAWEKLRDYDFVVSLPNSMSPTYKRVVRPPSKDIFDLVLVDEAHHLGAASWQSIFELFPDARKFLFTASPYRNDNRPLSSNILYEYSIRHALDDKVFSPIEFIPVEPRDGESSDVALARETERQFQLDRHDGLPSCVLVRTNSIKHAADLQRIYSDVTQLRLKTIHSKLSAKAVDKTIQMLKSLDLDGIICVQMLGEGFDFEYLKIAAIHQKHASFPITMQFIGRFVRTVNQETIRAKFLAEPSEIAVDTQQLYQQGKVWGEMIPALHEGKLEGVRERIKTDREFKVTHAATRDDLKDWSASSAKPSFHAKIYKTKSVIHLERIDLSLKNREIVFRSCKNDGKVLLLVTRRTTVPRWTDDPRFETIEYGLLIIQFDKRGFLFISSTEQSESLYVELVNKIDSSANPLTSQELNKVLQGLRAPEFFNIGIRSRVANTRSESYRILTGANAQRALKASDGRIYHQGHVFGRGETNGGRVTIGYSSNSKVWSNSVNGPGVRLIALSEWFTSLADKFTSSNKSTTGSELDQIPLLQPITKFLEDPLVVADWPESAYRKNLELEYSVNDTTYTKNVLEFNLEIISRKNNKAELKLYDEETRYNFDFLYTPLGTSLYSSVSAHEPQIRKQNSTESLLDYLTSNPLRLHSLNQSVYIGREMIEANTGFVPFSTDRIMHLDWQDVDIRCEVEIDSAASTSNGLSVQTYLSQWLQNNSSKPIESLLFCDHGTGEIADFVHIKAEEDCLIFSLYHVKAKKSNTPKPGVDLSDIYELIGQSIKCTYWLDRRLIIDRMLRRGNDGNRDRYIVGNEGMLQDFRKSDTTFTRTQFNVYIVQPGISKQKIEKQTGSRLLETLAAANDYLIQASCMEFGLICSR